jgi:hypothetical protein
MAAWLAGKLLKTKDDVRLALDRLGTVGHGFGPNSHAMLDTVVPQ